MDRNLAFYTQELSADIPKHFFKQTPLRLLYFPFFFCLLGVCIWAQIQFQWPWYGQLLMALVMGHFSAGLVFLTHELMHGQIVKSQKIQNLGGLFGLSPFLVSPSYWRYWHNYLHHGNTQYVLKDPDAFPPLIAYKNSTYMKRLFDWTPGAKTIRSYGYFFFWFSTQAVLNQIYFRFHNKMWDRMNHRRVTIEFAFQVVMMATYVLWASQYSFLFLVLIPFLIQNYVVMSYISTNHNLSPLTKVNDPLENSLTVTTNPVFDFFHLNFGYHVEHHLFPRMSGKYAKKLHQILKVKYPEEYKFMPKWKAIGLLYKTARIYKGHNHLIHPKTGEIFETIQSRPKAASVIVHREESQSVSL